MNPGWIELEAIPKPSAKDPSVLDEDIETFYQFFATSNEMPRKSQLIEALMHCVGITSKNQFVVRTRQGLLMVKPGEIHELCGGKLMRFLNHDIDPSLNIDTDQTLAQLLLEVRHKLQLLKPVK
jgi:hypothetical protein